MTIKEIEQKSGMDRANIRYYEREGFISPSRLSNSYRDYTEEDLAILLKIKLLRKLDLPIEVIRSVQSGRTDLAEALARQIRVFEQEKNLKHESQALSRALFHDQVQFDTLDAKLYLDKPQQPSQKATANRSESIWDKLPYAFRPWQRYFARILDIYLYQSILHILLRLLFTADVIGPYPGRQYILYLFALIVMLIVEPVLLRLFRTTAGKAILGLYIEKADGQALTVKEARSRTWQVLFRGMGFGILFWDLIRYWKNYKTIVSGERLDWDMFLAYSAKPRSYVRYTAYVVTFIFTLLVVSSVGIIKLYPPVRGDLRVSDFAENYRYYEKYFSSDIPERTLDDTGNWQKSEQEGVIIVPVFETVYPDFSFETQGDRLHAVGFTVVIRESGIVSSYSDYMLSSALALIGAGERFNPFGNSLSDFSDEIHAKGFEDFDLHYAGYQIRSRVRVEGYYIGRIGDGLAGFAIPEGEADRHFIRIEFDVRPVD